MDQSFVTNAWQNISIRKHWEVAKKHVGNTPDLKKIKLFQPNKGTNIQKHTEIN